MRSMRSAPANTGHVMTAYAARRAVDEFRLDTLDLIRLLLAGDFCCGNPAHGAAITPLGHARIRDWLAEHVDEEQAPTTRIYTAHLLAQVDAELAMVALDNDGGNR